MTTEDPFEDPTPRVSAFASADSFRGRLVMVEPIKVDRDIPKTSTEPNGPRGDRVTANVTVVDGQGPVITMTTQIEERMKQHFRSKPVHITWAMKDRAFLPSYLDDLWLDTFPDATVTKLGDAGHYLQEDAHERIVPELVRFVDALPDS